MIATLALTALGGYLLGSIPFGLVLTRAAGLGDIRAIGSGNIGATNVLRTGRKGLALATLLLDGGKGAMAVGLAWAASLLLFVSAGVNAVTTDGAAAESFAAVLTPETVHLMPLVAGFAAVLGHNFPVWLKFKGGKGVATTLGTLFAVAWPVGLACVGTWLVVAAVFRISSLSALVALALSPLYAWIFADPATALMAAGLAVLGFIRHEANIRRLLKGEEPRIGKKKS
ncbi:MAG: glycerol-3-phosphate 1-O-acyltransferase PlsY [Solirubrobacterales bacterium]